MCRKHPITWGLCSILAVAACVLCCGGESRPSDPRKWTHEQLMAGSALLSPGGKNGIQVLQLSGSPYQMGYQHGVLFKDRFELLRQQLENDFALSLAIQSAFSYSPDGKEGLRTYADYAMESAFDLIKEECEGLVAGCDALASLEECVVLNSSLLVLDDMIPRYFPGIDSMLSCTEFVAAGPGTLDGKLIHGRNMDFLNSDAIMKTPTVFVRRPDRGLKHVTVGWPGLITGVTGMNEAGVAIATNDISCNEGNRDLTGMEPSQLIRKILSEARGLEQAEDITRAAEQASCELFVISHGPSRQAAVLEISAKQISTRRFSEEQILLAANHFVQPDMVASLQDNAVENLASTTVTRHTRLRERLTGESLPPHPGLSPADPDYAYGKIDLPMAIDIMRDPLDLRPDQNRFSFPCTEFVGSGWAIGNNHNVHSIIMVPEDLTFWLAAGWDAECKNAVYNPYVPFELTNLFKGGTGGDGLPVYDPPYQGGYGTGIHASP